MNYKARDLSELKKIPLDEFLIQEEGYAYDKAKSSKNSPVLMSKAGEKIILKQSKTGDYIFFSSLDYSGTIVDYLQHKGLEMKDIYASYINRDFEFNQERNDALKASVQTRKHKNNLSEAFRKYHYAKHYGREHFPVLNASGISQRNFGKLKNVRKSSFSIVFPFYSYCTDGDKGKEKLSVTGIYHHKQEIKPDEPGKIFQSGSVRGLGILTENPENRYVKLCEQPIDALAHREMMLQKGKAVEQVSYICSGGSVGEVFLSELGKYIADKQVKHVFLGFDNDSQGRKFTQKVEKCCTKKGVPTSVFVPQYGDWQNDLIRLDLQRRAEKQGLDLCRLLPTLDAKADKLKIKCVAESGNEKERTAAVALLSDEAILRKLEKKENNRAVKQAIKAQIEGKTIAKNEDLLTH